eukprot:2347030-Rhodomonas_salina.1
MRAPPGSDALADCVCRAGFFPNSSTACGYCPANFFCLGGVPPAPCAPHSLTPAGSNHSSACTCDRGYYGPPGGPCELCPAGSWCWGGVRNDCPSGLTSLPGLSWPQNCTDIDECATAAHDCAPNATCTNEHATFSCACDFPFAGDGRACVWDACARGAHACHADANCTDVPATFTTTCACRAPFEGDGGFCECPRGRNVWEFGVRFPGNVCSFACHAGGRWDVATSACVAAPLQPHSAAALVLVPTGYNASDDAWHFAGDFHRGAQQLVVAYVWSRALDPFGVLLDAANHPCQGATSPCCLESMRT